jgi:hypothetical protein
MNKYRFHSVLFLIGFLWLLMLRTVYAGLPWDVIAEKYDQGVLLFEKVPNLSEDSVSKDFEINVDNFNYPDDIGEVTVSFQRWSAGKWNPIGQASLGAADGKMPGKNLGDGFYKTQLDPSGDDPNSAKVYYFLLKSDWKKDLLGFCRQARHQIETHPQAHDIRASIALSHYDNLLEDIVASQYLTGKVMGRLSESNRSKRQFLQGQIPDFVKGLSALRFKRFEGAEYA